MQTALKLLKTCFGFVLFLSTVQELAAGENEKAWEIGLTFGEIPVLSGSFKPGVTFAFHYNDHISLQTCYHLKDYLQRDGQSFNARNIGFTGLLSSKETTGERILFALQIRPVRWSPYIVAGLVFNNADIETMRFDHRERQIGDNTYDTELTIVQQRERGFAPALGCGYRYDFDNGLSININIAAAVFKAVPTPIVAFNSPAAISAADHTALEEKIDLAYKENFHNRYHIFNLGLSYRITKGK